MAAKIYGLFSLTGGGANALDSIDGYSLENGDGAIVFTSGDTYIYTLDSTSGASESSPDVITPDNNPDSKRWLLVSSSTKMFLDVAGDILPDIDNTRSIGSAELTWKDVYVGPGSLYVNGQKVLQDDSGTIVVSADVDQNLQFKTTGTGDVEFLASGTGQLQMKSTVSIGAGINIISGDGNAINFTNDIDINGEVVTGSGEPQVNSDLTTKSFVEGYASNASNLTTGTIPSSVLPPIAIVSVQTAADETAMLALTTQEGDVVVRLDEEITYMKNDGVAGTMADFTSLASATEAPVQSVNGDTGTVVLTQDDVANGATYVRTENNLTDSRTSLVDGATNANTASTIVKRDASGDFSANVITATCTTARYADIAERYTNSDVNLPVGTVINACIYGEYESQMCLDDKASNVIGIVSKTAAYLMDADLGNSVIVGLKGKVPVRIIGQVQKGMPIVSAGAGCARQAVGELELLYKIGIAMHTELDPSEKLVMCAI